MAKVISLFSGAGGLDYGLEAAGFEFGAGVEMDSDSISTLLESRPDWPVVPHSIFDTDAQTPKLLDLAASKKGDIDLVAGGPPCQPFSKSGYWARGDAQRLRDPRSDTLGAFIRVVRESLPKVMLLENVEGLQYAGKDEGLQLLVDELDDINKAEGTSYHPWVDVLNAADYGVPQLRERVFVVAHREGREFKFPPATHRPTTAERSLLQGGELETYRTAWDALADIAVSPDEDLRVRGKWATLLASIPEGCNYLHHTDGVKGCLCLDGGVGTGRFCSSSPRIAPRGPSRRNQGQPSAHSIGAIAGSAFASCVGSKPSLMTSRSSGSVYRHSGRLETRCRHSWQKSSGERFANSFSTHR